MSGEWVAIGRPLNHDGLGSKVQGPKSKVVSCSGLLPRWLLCFASRLERLLFPSKLRRPCLRRRKRSSRRRVDARKEVIVNWYLDGQAWLFRDIMTAYEPVKGYQEIARQRGHGSRLEPAADSGA